MEKDVIKYRTILLIAICLLASLSSLAQTGTGKLKKRVTVHHNETRVDSFLNLLAKQTGIGFSFNSKKISPTKMIPVRKGVYTLEECLLKIQQAAGIHYAVLSNHIILVDNPPLEKYRLQLSPAKPVKTAPVAKTTLFKSVTTKKVVTPKPAPKQTNSTRPQQLTKHQTNVDSIAMKIDSVVKDTVVRIDTLVHKDSTVGKGLFVRKGSIVRVDSTDPKGWLGRINLFGPIGLFGQKDTTERIDSSAVQKKDPATTAVKKPAIAKINTKNTAAADGSTNGSKSNRGNDRASRSDRKVRIAQGTPSYGNNPGGRDKDWNLIAGATLLRPDFTGMNIGIGVQVQYERFFGNKWSWTGAVGYNYIMGNAIFQDSVRIDASTYVQRWDTIKHFSYIPVLLGLRYYVYKPFYLSFETGYSIKADNVVASCMTFSPAIGMQIPVGKGAIDVNLNYLWLKEKMTVDKPRFQRGGLGFWCLRAGWAF